MMSKKILTALCILCFTLSFSAAYAGDFVVKHYVFTWNVAKFDNASLDIQKTPKGLSVILKSLGGPLATLTIPPAQAKEIGQVLKKTDDYYNEQKNSDDLKSSKTVRAGLYKVTFSSKQGSSFVAEIAESKLFGSAVLLSREDAVTIGKYLRVAEEMAAFADKKVRP